MTEIPDGIDIAKVREIMMEQELAARMPQAPDETEGGFMLPVTS